MIEYNRQEPKIWMARRNPAEKVNPLCAPLKGAQETSRCRIMTDFKYVVRLLAHHTRAVLSSGASVQLSPSKVTVPSS